jgi:hypothetical protein
MSKMLVWNNFQFNIESAGSVKIRTANGRHPNGAERKR